MGVLELRNKLIEQFNTLIQDDSKLMFLDGVFDALNTHKEVKEKYSVPDTYYKILEERRHKYHTGEANSASWEEVKNELKKKYGF